MAGITNRGLRNTFNPSTGRVTSSGANSPVNYGRVVDVIMDSTHPKWKDLGGTQSQYGVFYQKIDVNDNTLSDEDYNFAYCRQNSFRRIPVKNEIVSLETDFRADVTEDLEQRHSDRVYWNDIVPLWNSTHLNAYPDIKKDGNGPADTGKNFKETDTVKPLQLCDGDISLEGRHGNTIRLGGTKRDDSPISKPDVNGKPYIIVRAGQVESSADAVFEDIDKDGASMYFVSDHKVPLTQANDKRAAWKNNKGPKKAKDYKGVQIVANANRIFLNARENDIELSAKEEIGLNGKLISLDGKDYVAFDADKIYLGTGAFQEIDPVLLGTKTTNWLANLCSSLIALHTVMSKTVSPAQLPSLAAAAEVCKAQITGYKSNLPNLKSKKSFVE